MRTQRCLCKGAKVISAELSSSAPHFLRYTWLTAGRMPGQSCSTPEATEKTIPLLATSLQGSQAPQERCLRSGHRRCLSRPLSRGVCCPQARRRSRAAAILEAAEEPRPGAGGLPAEEPGSSEMLPPLSAFLLSPLSSLDLSAEPLSPTTTAALQALRERQPPPAADSRGSRLEHASAPADAQGDCRVFCT